MFNIIVLLLDIIHSNFPYVTFWHVRTQNAKKKQTPAPPEKKHRRPGPLSTERCQLVLASAFAEKKPTSYDIFGNCSRRLLIAIGF